MHLLAVFILIFGASVISAKPATALADQTVNCGSGGTFTIVSNVVTTSSLTCAGSVVIPTGVTSIADNAFSRSSSPTDQSRITSVSISNTVTSVGNGAFWANSGVTSLTIGSSVSSIGRDAFRALSSITALVVPGSVKSIGAWAFADMGATTLTLNEGLETVGDGAFIGNRLITIVIPNSVTTISFEAAFAGYWVLENLTLGSGLTTIGGRAFD